MSHIRAFQDRSMRAADIVCFDSLAGTTAVCLWLSIAAG